MINIQFFKNGQKAQTGINEQEVYENRCSTALPISEMLIKTTVRTATHPPEWLKIKTGKMKTGSSRNPHVLLAWRVERCNLVQPRWKTVWQFSPEWNVCLLSASTSTPREMSAHVRQKTYTRMFTATLFVRVRKWKLLTCPSMVEWTNKL